MFSSLEVVVSRQQTFLTVVLDSVGMVQYGCVAVVGHIQKVAAAAAAESVIVVDLEPMAVVGPLAHAWVSLPHVHA